MRTYYTINQPTDCTVPDIRAYTGLAALRAAQRADGGLEITNYWEIMKLLGECPEVLGDGRVVRRSGGCPDAVEDTELW